MEANYRRNKIFKRLNLIAKSKARADSF